MVFNSLTASPLIRRLLWLATLIALLFPAVQPLLQGQLPWSADGTLHLYRLVSLDHALADGTLWARYAPGMAYGYGAPFFNYYSPVSLYPLLALHKLGLSFLDAWLWGMVFYTGIAAAGAYVLGRAWGAMLPRRAAAGLAPAGVTGWLTAAAYIYAPYSLFDSIWRGTVSEYAALALLPWVLWGVTRFARTARRIDWLLSGLAFALFVLMHNVITLHGSALIAGYALLVWLMLTLPATSRRRALLTGGGLLAVLLVGMLLTAFFWLPALTETRYVKLDAITATLPEIDVTRNLTDIRSLFALPAPGDPTRMQPPIPIALSWTQLALAGVAAGWAAIALPRFRQQRETRALIALIGFSGLMIALLLFMNLHAAAGLWEIIPLIRYSQFPWRLIGLASLLLALLAGVGGTLLVGWVRRPLLQTGVVAVALVAVIGYSLPLLYPAYLPEVNPDSIQDAQDFERESGFIVTSSFGEYLPVWNYTPPDADALIARFEQSAIVPRLLNPETVSIHQATWRGTSGTLDLSADAETTLTFAWFYFPGWQATLDDRPLEVTPTDAVGLVQVTIPAGQHRLTIWLGNTDRQNQAWLLTAGGLLLLMAGGIFGRRLMLFAPAATASPGGLERETAGQTVVLVTALVLIAFKVGIVDRGGTFLMRERFAGDIAAAVQHPLDANFASQITLIGFDAASTSIPADAPLDLTLYWRLNGEAIASDYSTVLSLRDASGDELAQVTAWQPGGLATSHWRPGMYLQQHVAFDMPPGTPPGSYTLDASLYDPVTGRSLDRLNAAGNPEAVQVGLVSLTVTRPPTSPDFAAFTVAPDAVTPVSDTLTLVRLDGLPTEAGVGQEVRLTWVWRAEVPPAADLHAKLVWMQDGQPVGETPLFPLLDEYPTSNWQAGDMWRGAHRVYVPGALDSGMYPVALVLDDAARSITYVAKMQVTAPERTFTLPEMTHPTDATWSNGIRLAGYDLAADGALTLYWQTDTPLITSLITFIHVVDASGLIVAQATAFPGNQGRPTTGWAPGEVLTDESGLSYPADAGLEVRVGWFDPLSGQRVLLSDGREYLVLRR